jgi:hypothetical protein
MNVETINGRKYHLPDRQSAFQKALYVHLIDWKWKNISTDAGYHMHRENQIPYDAILPEALQGKMPHLYPSVVRQLADHRQRNHIRIHPHFYHMASSQAANINLFLPILHHSRANAILAEINHDFVSLATDQLDNGYCLEYWGGNFGSDPADKGPLGDKSSRAGTDSDIAIAYRNSQDELCLWLIEHKLTEAEFTTCGGFKSAGRNERHDCSRSFSAILANTVVCYHKDVRQSNYWSITERNADFFVNHGEHKQCPFQGGMNQLWRNQLLAMAIEQDEKQPYKHARFSVVKHPANASLDATLGAFGDLVGKNPKFSVFTSEDVLHSAEAQQDDELNKWATWYRNLYML